MSRVRCLSFLLSGSVGRNDHDVLKLRQFVRQPSAFLDLLHDVALVAEGIWRNPTLAVLRVDMDEHPLPLEKLLIEQRINDVVPRKYNLVRTPAF